MLQFAFLFMNTSTVSIAFIPQKEVSIFQHSLGIYDNQMAICSYGFTAAGIPAPTSTPTSPSSTS